ncbi:hypothetical protein CEXT_223701 [Caerostris extrusa]|uniref:Uncharacterized protein n=1 Tax=Caerostris extrusa TaxID=172846 RepID=A0AAV4XTL5_CAEEX|nr:hypothetical protein CEXT_223701 [Caerostris extrusa]
MVIQDNSWDAALDEISIQTKVLVVGDPECGRSSFINSFYELGDSRYELDREYEYSFGTVYQCYANRSRTSERVSVYDVKSAYLARVPPSTLREIHSFIFCYSIADPLSFQSIESKWFPLLEEYVSRVSGVMVGTHKDLRDDDDVLKRLEDEGLKPVSSMDGFALKKNLGFDLFKEFSNKDGEDNKDFLRTVACLSSYYNIQM